MPALPSNNAQSEVKAILDLNDLLMSDGVLRDVKITDVLRVSVASQVFRIKHQGQIFILKRYVHENAVRSVENIMRELPISAEVLHNNHSHHVNKLVMGRPDLGLVLLEYCKGKTLGTHLRTSDIGKQKRLMRAAGDWLKAYTQPRICEKKFAPSFWTQRCDAMPLDWLSSPDRELFCKATDTLRQWGAKLQGVSVRHSVIHGDFHADNLIFHNANMTGIDMERASWAPIAYDASTMFVFLQKISAPDLSDETRLVLQQEFLGQGPLAPSEHSTILPFLMAVRLLHIFHRTHPREHGNPRFESMRLGIRALITSQGLLH